MFESETCTITATNSNKQSTVSRCDWPFLVGYSWSLRSNGYFCCNNKGILYGQEIHNKPMHWFVTRLIVEQNNFVIKAPDNGRAIVSRCDWPALKMFQWYNHKGILYCIGNHIWWGQNVRGKPLHWFVAKLMGFDDPDKIDHINHDESDNRQHNLIVNSEKMDLDNLEEYKKYDSGFEGVTFDIETHTWMAHIRKNGESVRLCSCDVN